MWHLIEFRRRVGKEGTLKYLALWILSESPKNGVEIINEIEKMTWGWWRPSPGSVYPLLSSLLSEGLVEKTPNGKYKLTEKGINEIKEILPPRKLRTLEDIINEIEGYIAYLEETGKENLIPYKNKLESIKLKLERLIT